MTDAQSSVDRFAAPVCPEELISPMLHKVLSFEPLRPYIFGGKGVGSQGDGTAQFLARSQSDQDKVIEVLEKQLGLPAYKLTLRPGLKVRKALIPAAGFGTRLFPATKATKKELFRSSTAMALPSLHPVDCRRSPRCRIGGGHHYCPGG